MVRFSFRLESSILGWAYMFFFLKNATHVSQEELDYIKSDKDEVAYESKEEQIPWLHFLGHKQTLAVIMAA